MPEIFSNLVWFKNDDAHRTGPPKRHTDTSSKRPLEAMVEKGMREDEKQIIRRTWGAALKKRSAGLVCISRYNDPYNSSILGGIGGGADMIQFIEGIWLTTVRTDRTLVKSRGREPS
jgi:hypothetical protein